MKSTAKLLIGLAVVAVASSAWADTRAKEEAAIRNELTDVTKAYANRDADGAMAPYTEDTLVFDLMPPIQQHGFAGNLKTTKKVIESCIGPFIVEYNDVHVTVDRELAVSTALVRIAGNMKDGRKIDMMDRTTDVWKKIKGKWRIIHEHNSVPIDMVTGKANFHADLSGDAAPFEENKQ